METYIRISSVLSTTKKVRMLQEIIYGGNLTVSGVARGAGVDKGSVSRYFSELSVAGILKRKRRKVELNGKCTLVKGLKIILSLSKLDIRPFDKTITGIGLYGSRAKGTDDADSDFDIWVRTKRPLDEWKTAEFEYSLSKKLGAQAKILVLTSEKEERLRKEDPGFYYSMASGSIILWGEGFGD